MIFFLRFLSLLHYPFFDLGGTPHTHTHIREKGLAQSNTGTQNDTLFGFRVGGWRDREGERAKENVCVCDQLIDETRMALVGHRKAFTMLQFEKER